MRLVEKSQENILKIEDFEQEKERLLRIAKEVGPAWVGLAKKLNFSESEAENIKTEFDSPERQCVEMLIIWKKLQATKDAGTLRNYFS